MVYRKGTVFGMNSGRDLAAVLSICIRRGRQTVDDCIPCLYSTIECHGTLLTTEAPGPEALDRR